MSIQYALEDRASQQLKMWAVIWSFITTYWPEGIVGFISWCVIVFFVIKTCEEFNIRKQRRRYREEDDIGRRRKEEDPEAKGKSGGSQNGVRVSTTRKRKLQKSLKHAKQELLSSGVSGSNSKPGSKTRRSK